MIKLKICGIKTMEEVEIVNRQQPDYVGFVFAEGKRKVSDELAWEMRKHLNSSIQAVGVFVREPVEHVIGLVNKRGIDVIQLHGEESDDYVKRIRERVTCPIIRATRIRSIQQQDISTSYCDYVLYDSYVAGTYGGSGVSIPLSYIPMTTMPVFMAGGIHEENMAEIITRIHPYGIDISSGVESNGRKDEEKIRRIIEKLQEIRRIEVGGR